VDMPVFFYIDPDYVDDPSLEYTDDILLSYTFFEAKKGLVLPSPFERPPETQQAQIASVAS
jgi:cytochrome c oxidase assembly protein subunit 11